MIKFSWALLSGSFFLVGMVLDNHIMISVSGIGMIIYLISNRMNQMRMQYEMFKKIPKQLMDVLAHGEITGIEVGEHKPEDKERRGYQ